MTLKPFFQNDMSTVYNCDAFELLAELSDLDGVITDPPYSSGGLHKGARSQSVVSKYVSSTTKVERSDFTGDNRDQRSYMAWSTLWLTAAYNATRDKGHLLVFIDWRQLPTMTDAVQAAGWLWQGTQVWHKPQSRPRPNAFRADSEFIVWATKGQMGKQDNKTATYLPGVYKCSPPSNRSHTTQKPVEMLEWLCSILPSGSKFADPFMGSGSTLIAGRNKGLYGIGADLSEQFCEHAAGWLGDSDLAA
jgi:site-specific DNA-methyltransferase (adenine-specific)